MPLPRMKGPPTTQQIDSHFKTTIMSDGNQDKDPDNIETYGTGFIEKLPDGGELRGFEAVVPTPAEQGGRGFHLAISADFWDDPMWAELCDEMDEYARKHAEANGLPWPPEDEEPDDDSVGDSGATPVGE